MRTELPATNRRFAMGGVSCSTSSLAVAESFVLRINFSGKNSVHRKPENLYQQALKDIHVSFALASKRPNT